MNTAQTELPALPREIRQEFQATLERAFREGGATTTAEQLRILEGLLDRAVTLGETPAGEHMLNVNRDLAIDYTNPRVIRQAASRTPSGDRARVLAGLAIAGVAALLLLLNAVLGHSTAAPPLPSTPLAVGTGTPVPTATALPVAQIKIGGQGVPAVFPVTLQIGGHAWAVTAAPVDAAGGNWQVSKAGNLVNWLPGSLVNWCFGLWSDANGVNRGVLSAIGPAGTTATMRMSSGVARHFHLGAGRPVSHLQSAIFAQGQPGVTVLLLGTPGDDRLVVQGQEELAPVGAGATPSPGAPRP